MPMPHVGYEPPPIIDQPPPAPNERPHIADLVIADIQDRKRLGIERYGTALQPHNGRDALVDAYQEVLDLAMYVRQEIEERADQHAEGASAEHASVVAHLNRLAESASCADARAIYMHAASEIERGRHHDTWPAPPPDSDVDLDDNTATGEP